MAVMPLLGKVDAVVTDPPYGVNGGSGTMGKASEKTKYNDTFEDTPENITKVCVPAIKYALTMCDIGIITPGSTHCFEYPSPDDMGIIYQPAATGMSKWGRATSQPVLFYGRDPFVGLTIQPKHIIATRGAEKNGHPCPKPIYVAEWMVGRSSRDAETILDPFMGSGTTGVACAKMGRKFIGIELDPDYFEIACKRIQKAYDQPDLFVAPPSPNPTQGGLDL